jgi:hypothetical protein
MADGRDVFRGLTDVMSGGREDQADDGPARTEEEFDRRARYLAKAASLGHMVSDDDSPGGDR